MNDPTLTRRITIATTLTLCATLFASVGLHAQADEAVVGLPVGAQAPAVTVQNLDGKPVQLLDYVKKGEPALIEFWATWCENCQALQPQLDRIQQRWGDRLSVVAVAVAVAQTPRRVRRHVESHDPGYPYLWDGDGAAVRAYNAPTTSVVVMLNAEGKVVYSGVGSKQDLTGEVAKLMGSS
jgi:thiol-disulfide isomerase/thioredoxin